MPFFKKKISTVLIGLILLGSAFAFVRTERSFEPADTPQDNNTPQNNVPKDSSSSKALILPIRKVQQDTYEDIQKKYPMDAPMPDNVKTVVEYDPASGNYMIRTYLGKMEIASPFSMTEEEYRDYSAKQAMRNYWREKNTKGDVDNEDKFSISDMKFEVPQIDKVFGPGGVQVKTQGSAELIFGVRTNSIDNPTLPQRQRKTINPDFDQKIQLNVNGKVGNKINFGLNYNTEASFDHDQKLVTLKYQPPKLGAPGGGEDDIIRNIEAGNVSMQLNSSLISGSTSLFGIKTELQFGKLNITALASQQKSESKTVNSKGGVQTTDFEINIDNYDENRHFFLGHYFRGGYEKNISKLPYISSGVQIQRIEVWITNKRGNYDQARNIVAFMDLAEDSVFQNTYWQDLGATKKVPRNEANKLYGEVKVLPDVRLIQKTNSVLSDAYSGQGIEGGEDYEKIESARRLEPSEYTLNKDLGYISLRSALNPDEALAVAFEYTYGGETYLVGEFSTDRIVAPQALIVKLLKGSSLSPELKTWNLMMKNIYSIGASQIQSDNFKLDIVYKNDSIGTDLQYISEGDIANKLLLRVMNLDRLNSKNDPAPDGRFDYVEGYTVISNTGRIIFPVLEPFGSHLRDKIGAPNIAKDYVYQELYDSTLVIAQEFSEKNKFRLVGEYKGSSGSEIRLNAMNVPRGSVTVTAGGRTLVENTDYTVDYTMGSVRIINQSLLDSSTNIEVKLENQSMFSMQRKTLLGTHLEYQFSKDFSLGGTIMHLSEMPLTTKVNTGNEPISNTIWGLNTSWRGESQWLTNMIDKLPFVNATRPSTIALNAEFAQLIPGHSKVVSDAGLAYIDDFESTKTRIDVHYPYYWKLASTPSVFTESTHSDSISYGFNRSLLAWYNVDRLLNEDRRETPKHLQNNLRSKSDHRTRSVPVEEVFPNKDQSTTENALLSILNLSYYPTERGPYNLDTEGMNPDGSLNNPKKRWGGMMRKLDQTDFETANIEYIEFWVMDPFITDTLKTHKGGKLVFNLGDVSEDVLKDGKKFFEHGLSIDGDITKNETTVWGAVPKTQSTTVAFSGDRKTQDVGLNGLSTEQERIFPTYADYLNRVRVKVSPATLERFENDPSGDNYHYYRGSDYDAQELSILERYKYYNNTEGNSPDAADITETYSTSATTIPDVEDVNEDNTLNEYEKYFEYEVPIDRNKLIVGENFVTDKITRQVSLKNGNTEEVNWYQFRIPLRDESTREPRGTIRNLKSVRFMRIYLTDFEQDIHLRFATMDLVRGEWRTYTKELQAGVSSGVIDVQAVNYEENSDKTPVNYILPPGVTREVDPGQPQVLQQNEQSMLLKVTNLAPGEAKAVYKNTAYDMRNYKRLQMFVHAEKLVDDNSDLKDYDLSCFIRIGSDMKNNYYEYEIPLKLTPAGNYSGGNAAHQHIVWPSENMFNFPFSVLTDAKIKRNKDKQNQSNTTDATPYPDPNNQNNFITIVGNPSISNVENIMIGIRNKNRESVRSGEIWVNELRMSEFEEDGGWAAMANVAVGLSDIGTVNFAGRTETAGFGSIESNVTNRRMDDLYQMSFSASMDLGRFLPEIAKIQLPAYYSYTNETLSPKYNPLDEDILLDDALDAASTRQERDSIKSLTQTVATSKSFNISGAKVNIKSKKPQFYDPANITISYSQSETDEHSAEIESNLIKNQKAAINYSYSFNSQPWEPFKESKSMSSPMLKLIKEFHVYYLPTSLSFNTNMDRQFSQVKLRSFDTDAAAVDMEQAFSNDFMWNRQFDFKYNLTRGFSLSLSTVMNANIDEGMHLPEVSKDYYDKWRDTVWTSIRNLGRPYAYQQVFNASMNVPINKLPMMEWITTSRVSYNSNYRWDRGAQIEGGTKVGNIAASRADWQADVAMNFETLYNKSKYLQTVNRRYSAQSANRRPFQPKTYTQTVNFEKGKSIDLNHRLGSDKLSVTALTKKGSSVNISSKARNATSLEIIPNIDADSVLITIVTKDPNERSVIQQVVDFSARTLMMLRSASVNYRRSSNLTLPGFKTDAGFLGQESVGGTNAPGYAFTFGLHDEKTVEEAVNKGWLYTNADLINPAVLAYTESWDIRVGLEPIPGLKIDLDAKRYEAQNTTTYYMNTGMPRNFTGSYNISTLAIATAFKPLGDVNNNYSSESFDAFLSNRDVLADRMNERYENTNYPSGSYITESGLAGQPFDPQNGAYSRNSPDVLIPAFLAAYTGRSAKSIETNPFLSIWSMMPNWRANYDGLSRIPFIKDRFRTVRLTHAYTSSFSIGSYDSYSTWINMPGSDGTALGYVKDVLSGNPIPSSAFNIGSVSLIENFSPLIGVNAELKNSLTPKVEYRKQRTMALNLTSLQLIETQSDEFVVGVGYVLKDFDVILRLKNNQQSRVKNDLKLNADISYKDIKSLLRKIDENVTQPSSGTKTMSIKIMADYVFSSKMNIQLFYDYQANTPLISTSYPTSASNFGMSFKFMLTR